MQLESEYQIFTFQIPAVVGRQEVKPKTNPKEEKELKIKSPEK